MPEDIFPQALKFVLTWEGGFVDDPKDRGGATNHGITQSVYDAWRKKNRLPFQSVKLISPGEVSIIYRDEYWEPFNQMHLDPKLQTAAFNAAVNMGIGEAKKLLARSGNSLDRFFDLQEYTYREYSLSPGQSKFLQGWLNRTEALKKMLGE